jgi:hypothetical protein
MTTSTVVVDEAGEREAFELWYLAFHKLTAEHRPLYLSRRGDYYQRDCPQAAWLAWLARAHQQPTAPEWIACSEQLPALDTPVLVICEPYPDKICAAMRSDGGEGWMWAVTRSYYDCLNATDSYEVDDDYHFSHWMPLPAPPANKPTGG